MEYAYSVNTNTIVSAHDALLLSSEDHFTCPSCAIELILRTGDPRRRPHFTLGPGTAHADDCEYKFSGSQKMKSIEFESLLVDLMSHHPSFTEVKRDQLLGHDIKFRADIVARKIEPRDRQATLHIECKTFPPTSLSDTAHLLKQLLNYKKLSPDQNIVLAIPATIADKFLQILTSNGIEVWDLEYLSRNFSSQIPLASPNFFSRIIALHARGNRTQTREESLIQDLRDCKPGKAEWLVYQKLVGVIFEHLFCPPLGNPQPESADYSRANRRDFIAPNYTDKGFWNFLRLKYSADYIVIDAKNHNRKVKKNDVLQVANYLKLHGAGLFAFIISRSGGDSAGCETTLREQWLVHQKMIIVLNDQDIEAMLTAKSEGREPTDLIGDKIEKFRLSM